MQNFNIAGVLVLGAVIAGCHSEKPQPIPIPDSPVVGTCSVLEQSGCNLGEKCTWFVDSTSPRLGHIGCAPDDGTMATGAACTVGAPGATGYDNCIKGDVCEASKCKTICDQNGGSPACDSTHSCVIYDGLFGPSGQTVAAGVCDAQCDPLADNDFDGSGGSARTGTTCGSDEGCYGFPSSASTTHWTCSPAGESTFVHRTACTGACANGAGSPYLNGCAQGYIPILYDSTGSTQVDCIALCQPASCSPGSGNCSNATIAGTTPYICKSGIYLQANGAFDTAVAGPGGTDGEHCIYSWFFEQSQTSGLQASPTSDTVGLCMDHSKYKWDPTGGSNATTSWPKCDDGTALTAGAGFGSGSTAGSNNVGAADFGCVDSMTAGLQLAGKPSAPVMVDVPRFPYARRAD
jgi:hypothetical protein